MGVTRLMLISSVHVGKGDMEELLMGKTKFVFPSAKTGKDDMGKLYMVLTRFMLISSVHVSKGDMEKLLIGKTKLMFPSAKTGEDDVGELPWG
jgi:hypothetical protein